ncbi:unnamed protein product [Calypogeia fissa]
MAKMQQKHRQKHKQQRQQKKKNPAALTGVVGVAALVPQFGLSSPSRSIDRPMSVRAKPDVRSIVPIRVLLAGVSRDNGSPSTGLHRPRVRHLRGLASHLGFPPVLKKRTERKKESSHKKVCEPFSFLLR